MTIVMLKGIISAMAKQSVKGAIVVNGYSYTDNARWQAESLKRALSQLNADAEIVKSVDVPAAVEGDSVKSYLEGCSFAVFLDKDRHIAMSLEQSGLKLFNSARAIELCDDKFLTYLALTGSGIDMPLTISAPLCYAEEGGGEFVERVAAELGFPLVIKECYGSMGQQVYMAEDKEQLYRYNGELKKIPHIYQKYIAASHGRDMRVIVIGGKTAAAMIRRSESGFRSNVEMGGRGEACQPPKSFIEMAEKCARVLGLDYCGVDILFDGERPLLCEVNSNAYFKKISEVAQTDIAALYARHIAESL